MKINDFELRHLRGVVAVAEELNFGRAAERLTMSQPPLTRLVADVEKVLGAKLFERTTRRVTLTPIGEVFVAEARTVLERMEDAVENVAAVIAWQEGLLRLAYVPLALQTVLPGLLAGFRAGDHDARIDMTEMPGPAQRDALRRGRIDFGLCDAPPTSSELGGVRLHREPLSLLVPETHPLAACASVCWGDLAGETLILHARQDYPEHYDRVQAACREVETPPRIWERAAGQNCMALLFSRAGLLLSPSASSFFPAQGLRRLPLRDASLYAEVWAVWRKAASSSRVQALAKIAQGQAG